MHFFHDRGKSEHSTYGRLTPLEVKLAINVIVPCENGVWQRELLTGLKGEGIGVQ